MRRFFKTLLISLLLILLVGVGFAWWLIQDGDWIRGKTERIVTQITGRDFSIGGDLNLDFSLNPNVVANDLRLANAPWAGQPDMVTLERLAFSVDLMSLFTERLVVHYIEADGVTLALAENETGEVNWDLFAQEDEAAEPPPGFKPIPLSTAKSDAASRQETGAKGKSRRLAYMPLQVEDYDPHEEEDDAEVEPATCSTEDRQS